MAESKKSKPNVAFYWCASCGGCEETIVDLDETLLEVADAVNIVFWPCALDAKYHDVEAMADRSIAVSFINGAIRTSEQEQVAKLLRRTSSLVVAFGSCACMGGIPALANLTSKERIFSRSYGPGPTTQNPEYVVPKPHSHFNGNEMTLPEFFDTVTTLDAVIDVDYYLPGCPPTPKLFAAAVTAVLTGTLPPRKSVLLPDKSLCSSCDRNGSKPDTMTITDIRRIHTTIADPSRCFLAQGIVCMGPATRDGCDYPCVKGNMPCTGCFGPVSGSDQGARFIASLGAVLDADTPEQANRIIDGIPDPAGTFYRYSLSSSLLGATRKEKQP